METAVFLPWRGEFGTMIMHHVRRVHAYQADRKVVCCRKGDEALFPSASDFHYDWEDLPDQQKKTRSLKGDNNRQYLENLEGQLFKRYPGCRVVFPEYRSEIDRSRNFRPEPRVRRGLSCDIAVAPRFRQHGEHRNYQHWPLVVQKLVERGHRVGLIGMRGTSIDCPGVSEDLKGWNYDSLDAHLELMQSARLVLATDSGLAHLAVLAGCPLKVIYDQPGKEAGHPSWPWVLPHMQAYSVTHCEPICHGWHDPTLVALTVDSFVRASL